MLDSFFASLAGHAGLERAASDRAFAQARNKLKPKTMTALNAQLLELAQARGWMPLWHGLRVVAADASVLMPAIRACHRMRLAAHPDQRFFGLYLPGPELFLHAQLYGPETGERQMLFENLHKLQANFYEIRSTAKLRAKKPSKRVCWVLSSTACHSTFRNLEAGFIAVEPA